MRCFNLHSTENMFCFVNQNIGLPWAIHHQKKRFCFFVAKTRWNQLYSIKSIFWFVCRKIVLLPALLHREKVFFQFAASHPDFHFTLLFCFCMAKWRCFQHYLSKNNLFLFFRYKNTFDALYYRRNVLVCWSLN